MIVQSSISHGAAYKDGIAKYTHWQHTDKKHSLRHNTPIIQNHLYLGTRTCVSGSSLKCNLQAQILSLTQVEICLTLWGSFFQTLMTRV